MGSIVRVSRKHQVVVDVEKGKVMIKARPKSYNRYMLGLHKNVWKGVNVEEYVRKERDSWRKEVSSRA